MRHGSQASGSSYINIERRSLLLLSICPLLHAPRAAARCVLTMSFILLVILVPFVAAGLAQSCRNIPGDVDWPTQQEWASLNTTVGGRLIATVPLASVCHDEGEFAQYNETACDALRQRWDLSQVQYGVTSYEP